MRIVVDTSVLVAAMMKDSRVRHTFAGSFAAEWIIPLQAKDELERLLPRIAAKTKIPQQAARDALARLLRRAVFVEVTEHDHEFGLAQDLIGGRDPSDVAFVAASLRTKAIGIWSLDNDFDGIEGVPRFTTAGVARLLKLVSGGLEREGQSTNQ